MRRPALALAVLLLVSECGRETRTSVPRERTLVVFAAASLTGAFREIASAFEAAFLGSKLTLSFAGSGTLARQIAEGAPADVFAAADEESMQAVVGARAAAGTPVIFAQNRMAIAVAKGNPLHIDSLDDLTRDDVAVVLCAAVAPCGRLARTVLHRANVRLEPVSHEDSVKAVASKVALGEADAGLVYVTDISAGSGLDAVPILDAVNAVARYPAVVLRESSERRMAGDFIEFLRLPASRDILRKHGFEVP